MLQVNLIQTLPEADRSKERLSELLDDRGLGFLCPLLRIQDQLWRQLQADPNPTSLYKWIKVHSQGNTAVVVGGFMNRGSQKSR